MVDLIALPEVALRAVLRFRLVKMMPEVAFRNVVMLITTLSAFLLLV